MMRDERGQSLIETIFLGLLLIVPLIWVLTVLADMHRGALASTAAVRDAAFVAARATTVSMADDAVARSVNRAFADHGLDPEAVRLQWTSSPGLKRGSFVEVRVRYPVTVVQAPFIGRVAGPSVWIGARHAAVIDPYRSRR